MIFRPESRSRIAPGLAALCLVVTACGGGDSDDTTADDGASASSDASSGASDDGSDGGGSEPADAEPSDDGSDGGAGAGEAAGPQRSPGDIVEFDLAALPTGSLDSSVLNYAGNAQAASTVTPVVDTCAVLSTTEVGAIATDIAERYSFGGEFSFTATGRGAACDYQSDTHRLTLTVGSSAEVSNDPLADGAFLPAGAGEVSTTPWDGDSSIVILSEDSFDLDTPYGALTTAGDLGVRVDNTGGTGIDSSVTGELFAELVAAAAANVGSAPAPSATGDGSAVAAGDPCSLWTAAELEAFLMGTPFGEPTQSNGPNACTWDGWDRGGASLSVGIFGGDNAYSFDSLEAVGSTGKVYTFIGGGLPIIVSPDGVAQATLRIDMLDGSIPDDAVIALAENLATRIG